MRESKFRSYYELGKCFVYFINGGYFNEKGEVAKRWRFDWENAEQHTGLKDKNGKEIFEGDILNCSIGTDDLVEFKKGCFWCRYRDIPLFELLENQIVEINANIHENGELLK